MSLVYGAAGLAVAVLAYQLLFYAHRLDPIPRWASHPLSGGALLQVSLWAGAFGALFALEGLFGGLGAGELVLAAAVFVAAAAVFAVQRRVFRPHLKPLAEVVAAITPPEPLTPAPRAARGGKRAA